MVLFRMFREAFRGFSRTGVVSATSVLTTAASLLVLGLFVQAAASGYTLAQTLRGRVEVDVYLKDGVSRRNALALAQEIEEMEGVAEARYVDQAEAAAEFRTMFGGDLLDVISRNPIPASVRVRLNEDGNVSSRAHFVATSVEGRRWVESVDEGRPWTGLLDRAVEATAEIAVLLGSVLCLACIFAVGNSSKIMILTQWEAIEVMRIVGATRRFIRMTFLLSGAILGCSGGLIAGVALWFSSDWWVFWIPDLKPLSPVYSGLGVAGLGALLGTLGSWTSLNRVLNAVSWKPG